MVSAVVCRRVESLSSRLFIPPPMLASPGGEPFTSDEWLYEIKLTDTGKPGTDCTNWYPEIGDVLAALPGGQHVIDGEACVLDHPHWP
jgi:hypothetical protein